MGALGISVHILVSDGGFHSFARPSTEDECTRLEQLVFIVFATQVAKYQVSNLRHVSVENPPLCRSWRLELVEDMLNQCCLSTVDFDCCMYGSADPGNLMAYKKAMRIACSVDLQALHIRCNKMHPQQIVQGAVQSAPAREHADRGFQGSIPSTFASDGFQSCEQPLALD